MNPPKPKTVIRRLFKSRLEKFDYLHLDPQLTDGFNVRECVDEILMKETIECALNKLSDREKTVIKKYYYEELTLHKIGIYYGVTRERIRQIQQTALRKLGQRVYRVMLTPFVPGLLERLEDEERRDRLRQLREEVAREVASRKRSFQQRKRNKLRRFNKFIEDERQKDLDQHHTRHFLS